MELEWLGEYREVIGSIYRAANAYSQVCRLENLGSSVKFSTYEVQIMENIMENEYHNMKWYAEKLGLSPSTYTKYVQKLVEKGLVEKYHFEGNNKDIILKVSELGLREYELFSKDVGDGFLKEVLSTLETMTAEEIAKAAKLLTIWGDACYDYVDTGKRSSGRLVKIEK